MTAEARPRGARLGWALAIIVGLYVLGRVLGVEALLQPERLRALVAQAGPWGPLAFVAVLVGGVLAQVPGLLFVTAAPLLFPVPLAWALCIFAGNVAVNANFAFIRRIGGQSLGELDRPWAQRILEKLDRNPLRSVILLRMALIMFPPLTGALALTRLNARDHALGSAVGLAFPISAVIWVEALLMWWRH